MTPTDSQIVSSCPGCGALAYLPPMVSTRVLVRCPKCHKEYRLESVLPASLPTLEIVNEELGGELSKSTDVQVPETVHIQSKFEVPLALKRGAKHRRSGSRHHRSDENLGGTDRSEIMIDSTTEQTDSQEPYQLKQRSIGERSVRKRSQTKAEPNGLMESIKMGLGALLALPVAQLIIWWFLGLDPLSLGPQVGKILPTLVPKSIREPAERQTPSFAMPDKKDESSAGK